MALFAQELTLDVVALGAFAWNFSLDLFACDLSLEFRLDISLLSCELRLGVLRLIHSSWIFGFDFATWYVSFCA